MTFYNMINGVDRASFYFLPMLCDDCNNFPRFRDCFLKEDGYIDIYTRMGGANRECWSESDWNDDSPDDKNECDCNACFLDNVILKHPNFVSEETDEFDCTYLTLRFSVPDKWKDDYVKLKNGDENISKAYRDQIIKIYPKLKDEIEKNFPI